MNIKVVILFLIGTAILHIILSKMEELKKENDELKYGTNSISEEQEKKPKASKAKKTLTIEDIKEARDTEIKELIPEKKQIKPEEQIKDDELRNDLLDFIKQSKTNRLVNSVKPENEVDPTQEN